MKKLYVIAFVLCIAASFAFTSKQQEVSHKLTATFLGLTDNEYYKFEDKDKKEYLFYEYSEEIDISLEDEDSINKKFAIIWVEREIELADEEGELTGKTIKIKSITALKVL